MLQFFDNYLLMHLTTFASAADFSTLVKTTHLFREPMVLECLERRLSDSISIDISDRIVLRNYMRTYQRHTN